MMAIGKYLILMVGVLGLNPVAVTQEAPQVSIIVNAANPMSEMTRAQISQLFLKKATHWGDGVQAMPVDLADTFPVRERFTQWIHKRTVRAVKLYWQQKIFSGREIPLPERESDAAVIGYVEEHAGAIGYVSGVASTRNRKVKVIKVME
jgi:ABC-type phosphate transport system substrate-binding protein